MNHSIVTADRNTHLKIAALALVGVIMVVVVGFSARVDVTARADSNGPAFKTEKMAQFATRFDFEVR